MEVVEDFQSMPHKAVSFVVEGDKEVQEWNKQKMPEGAAWLQWRKAARKKHKRKGREEEEEEEDSRERERNQG